MSELDYKESWALKNWCFWTVVLEKTLDSPLDCKEIQPVHPKGDHSWVFIGRIDVETETPILWPPHVKSWLTGKDPDAGKHWGQDEKGKTEDEMVGWHHWLDGHGFEQALGVGDGQWGLECCDPWGCRVRHDWATGLNWTELSWSPSSRGAWPRVSYGAFCLIFYMKKAVRVFTEDGARERRDLRATRQDPLLLTGLLALNFRLFAEHWTMRSLTLSYWCLEQTCVNALLFF